MQDAHTLDTNYFAAHASKFEYVRAPLPNEFAGVDVPDDAFVRVYSINRRSHVKVLERPSGERLASVIEGEARPTSQRRAA